MLWGYISFVVVVVLRLSIPRLVAVLLYFARSMGESLEIESFRPMSSFGLRLFLHTYVAPYRRAACMIVSGHTFKFPVAFHFSVAPCLAP